MWAAVPEDVADYISMRRSTEVRIKAAEPLMENSSTEVFSDGWRMNGFASSSRRRWGCEEAS